MLNLSFPEGSTPKIGLNIGWYFGRSRIWIRFVWAWADLPNYEVSVKYLRFGLRWKPFVDTYTTCYNMIDEFAKQTSCVMISREVKADLLACVDKNYLSRFYKEVFPVR